MPSSLTETQFTQATENLKATLAKKPAAIAAPVEDRFQQSLGTALNGDFRAADAQEAPRSRSELTQRLHAAVQSFDEASPERRLATEAAFAAIQAAHKEPQPQQEPHPNLPKRPFDAFETIKPRKEPQPTRERSFDYLKNVKPISR